MSRVLWCVMKHQRSKETSTWKIRIHQIRQISGSRSRSGAPLVVTKHSVSIVYSRCICNQLHANRCVLVKLTQLFKLCLLVVHLVINKQAPVLLLHLCPVGPQTAQSATTTSWYSQPDSHLANAPSPLSDPTSEISCPPTSKPSRTFVFLGANFNSFYFCQYTLSTY